MADQSELALSEVLCFVVNKFAKLPTKQMKGILVDFYSDEAVSEAKIRLLNDIEALELSTKLPHVSRRRDGDNRIVREVDDIITMIQYLDENKLLSSMPKYVSANPDNIPSSRLFEGDLNILMTMIEKIGTKMDQYGSTLSAIVREVNTLHSKFMSLEQFPPLSVAANASAPVQSIQPRQSRSQLPAQPWQQQPSSQAPIETPGGNSKDNNTASTADVTNKSKAGNSSADLDVQWSSLASSPQAAGNRFAVLALTDDDDNHDDQPFQLVRSQRSVRLAAKRQRQQSAAQDDRQRKNPLAQQRAQTVTGQSNATKLGLWAAKKTIKKAVFCVDNVGLTCKEDDIRAHVASLGAQVFSCFKTNPRRRPNETAEDVLDRKAFRLCVNAADRDRILDPDAWPDSIRIADWFFRDKNIQRDNEGKRQRLSTSSPIQNNQQETTGVKSATAVIDVTSADVLVERRDATAEATTRLAVQLRTASSFDDPLADMDCTFEKSTVDSSDATVLYDNGVTTV